MASHTSRIVLVLVFVCFFNGVSTAQSLYVAGSFGADVVLASGAKSGGLPAPDGGGESLSGAARLGVRLEPRWGAELEVSRGGEQEDAFASSPIPFEIVPVGIARSSFFPGIEFRRRVTTVSATASIRQQVSDNVALAYLGGVVFHRTDSRMDLRGFPGFPGVDLAALGLTFPASRVESVAYGAGPVVGFEAHIGYGEHLSIIPGVRMHGLPASWLVRPGVGVGWSF
jgi:hypothetical protein